MFKFVNARRDDSSLTVPVPSLGLNGFSSTANASRNGLQKWLQRRRQTNMHCDPEIVNVLVYLHVCTILNVRENMLDNNRAIS